jgi:hypothetical protein
MENWIGIGIWIVMGGAIGFVMKALTRKPVSTPGHTRVAMALGAFAAVIGGMLGVGIFHLYEPLAISPGGMGAAFLFAALMTFIYRWGIRGMV